MSATRTDCLSELELDRLLAGDPSPALRQRLGACPHCQDKLAALTAEQQARMTPDHVARQAAGIVARIGAAPAPAPRWRRWLVAPAFAFAAAVVLLAVWWRSPGPRPVDEIRVKGGPGFEVVLAAPGPARALDDGEAVPVDATLSFRATCPAGCSVALFDVSAGGIEPLADTAPPPWHVAGPSPLPVSAVVDRGPGEDVIVAFLCAAPRELGELRGALDAVGAAGVLAGARPALPGCDVRSHRIRRAP